MNHLPSAVGLDLEWPFISKRVGGCEEGKVALVQLCDADIILLIQVSKMKSASAGIWLLRGDQCTNFPCKVFPKRSRYGSFVSPLLLVVLRDPPQALIESSKVPKVGVNIRSE
jgi:hypothetical protein